MFIQVIKGPVSDADEARGAFDRWVEQEAPHAAGWLGSTSGVTDDGTFIALARFESEEGARRNSERPEQHQWWMETSKLFSGDVEFHDCREVIEFGGGGSDEAGFIQVMQGRVRDVERMRQLNADTGNESLWRDYRPDVLGGITALHGDGGFTTAVYFTSEQAAREGERKEPPAELKPPIDEEMGLYEGDLTFYDLRDPWLHSPR